MAARKQPTWRWGLVLIIVFVAVFAATRYFVANDIVDGTSMQPTFQSKQRLVSLKHRLPKRFDIIVLKRPHTLYIKRVIGVPGDTIKVVNGKLWLNGKRQSEPYLNTAFAQRELHRMQQNQPIKHFTADFSLTTLKATRTLKVPPHHYFVLGDNRLASDDSRDFGFISASDVHSVVVWRYWPLNQMRSFK